MNRNLCRHIAGCLGVAGPVDQHLPALRGFTLQTWQAVFEWLDLSGIALAFWDRIQKLGAESVVPEQLHDRLAAGYAENQRRTTAMTEEFGLLNDLFERAGIEYAVWKGFALIPEYCPDACLRPTYDYDYLISDASWDDAQRLLSCRGFVRKPHARMQGHVTFVPSGRRSNTRGYYAESLARKIELHRSAWEDEAWHISPGHASFERGPRTWNGLTFYSLAESEAFVDQVLHAFQHILDSWCRLGWLMEIAYFLQNRPSDASFWQKFSAHLAGPAPLSEILALVTLLAARLFYALLPAAIEQRIIGAMREPVALWVERYGLTSALDNFSGNKYALLLYGEFVRDETTWRKIRTSRLFPLHWPNVVAGAAGLAESTSLSRCCNQLQYVLSRLIHHSVTTAAYAWESLLWDRLCRLSGERILR